jgi:peroxiredoxin
LTFFAQRLAGAELSGRSELLGACHVNLDETDRLLIGPAIEQAASGLVFHQWKLKPAPEPLAAGSDAGPNGDGGEGLESSLVGKPAPDFELDLLDGQKFHLADHKDKVLVLDFWASWCGPCLQAMPQVDRVGREFAERGVRVIGVNLQEDAQRVKHALERLQLDLTVALDREGLVAEKYGATAIPQTVIIDRQGKIARLFVGGGARFDEQLRAALESVLAGQPAEPLAPAKTP